MCIVADVCANIRGLCVSNLLVSRPFVADNRPNMC